MVWRVRELNKIERIAVVEMEGVVDSTNVEEFFGFINSVFKKGIYRIVLDLEYTSYLSSGGLSVIIDAFNRAQKEKGKLVIARASDILMDLFEVLQFEKIIEFYDTVEDALNAL